MTRTISSSILAFALCAAALPAGAVTSLDGATSTAVVGVRAAPARSDHAHSTNVTPTGATSTRTLQNWLEYLRPPAFYSTLKTSTVTAASSTLVLSGSYVPVASDDVMTIHWTASAQNATSAQTTCTASVYAAGSAAGSSVLTSATSTAWSTANVAGRYVATTSSAISLGVYYYCDAAVSVTSTGAALTVAAGPPIP